MTQSGDYSQPQETDISFKDISALYVQGIGNSISFDQTQIVQISTAEIKTRRLELTSPYKGLRRFEPEDKDRFFGRDQLITLLRNELEQTNLILLLGSSGSGKSSVVRAGVVPWLREHWGENFNSLIFAPDQDPFESLYSSLLVGYKQSETQIARIGAVDTLNQVVNLLKPPKSLWLIVIDQFEELFTISDREKRNLFIESLVRLCRSRADDPQLKIIATMRAASLDYLSAYPELIRATEHHRLLMGEMRSDELRLAIEQPAARHGVVFETGLVEEIIRDVQGQAGYMPLLQYTLDLLWNTEVQKAGIDDRTLNTSTYRLLGGVRGALQRHIDQIYDSLSQAERIATKRIFLKLVEIGNDALSGFEWKPLRRRTPIKEFSEEIEKSVLTKLINENLVISDRSVVTNQSTVEIAHEILLTSWTTLQSWVQENRQTIALRNRLNDDVLIWQKTKRDDDLWTGSKLEQALELRKDSTFNEVLGGFSPDAKQFINASLRRQRNPFERLTNIFYSPLKDSPNSLDVTQQNDLEELSSSYLESEKIEENEEINPDSLSPEQVYLVAQSFKNDLAIGPDLLNVEDEINALAEVLVTRDLQPPLAVGILGSWGSGKSYAMHLMRERINAIRSRKLSPEKAWGNEKKHDSYVGHIYQIDFDAWTYAKADLWASLMQTIFYEFNRQLTLEKQIEEALVKANLASHSDHTKVRRKTFWQSLKLRVFPKKFANQSSSDMSSPDARILLQQAQLGGGRFWQVLNEMNESDRTLILQANLPPKAFERLKESKSQKELTDYLWKQIGELRQTEKQDLEEKAETLKQEKQNLRVLILLRAPAYLLKKNWLFFTTLFISAAIIFYPSLPETTKAKLPVNFNKFLTNNPLQRMLVGVIPTVLTGKSLWDRTREEQEKILVAWKKSQEAAQAQVKSVKEFSTTAYQDLLQSDSKIQKKLKDIQQLEAQIGIQQQQLGLSSTFPSLKSFISDRLQADSYSKQLGALQQVQRDLADLTTHFTFPSQSDAAKTEFKDKLEKLRQIFPRGPARIVLYIDDLDRCPPDQVVKVLEAVQLLLKTPLFIVVLGLDDRYIARALEKVYGGVLKRGGKPSGIDYLEKIIQIPYRVRPISQSAIEKYLRSLMDIEEVSVEDVELEKLNEQNKLIAIEKDLSNTSSASEPESSYNSTPGLDIGEPTELAEPAIDSRSSIEQENNLISSNVEQTPSPASSTPENSVNNRESNTKLVEHSINSEELLKQRDRLQTPNSEFRELPVRVAKFTEEEFRNLKLCCQQVDLSPRTIKRLINTYKILKIIWFRSNSFKNLESERYIRQTTIACLSLSGRYPHLMRSVFSRLEMYFEKGILNHKLINVFFEEEVKHNNYLEQEWNKFRCDVEKLIQKDIELKELSLADFSLILSFCFVGDIGYDPDDFVSTKLETDKHLQP